MGKQALGREQIHDAAWGNESYPHPLVSCMMPVATVIIIFLLVSLGFTLWRKSLPVSANVPKIKGISLDDAEKRLRKAGLDVEVLKDQQASETIPAGAVITSIPPEGRIIKEGRTVRLLISSGSQYTKVPNVLGHPQGVARQMLAKAPLFITSEVSQFDEKVPIDCIIAITPKPGAKVAKNSAVKLVLSRGSRADLEPGLVGDDALRSTALVVNIPADSTEAAEVHIDVTDDNGTRTVYRQTHEPGDTFVENVEGEGDTTAKVFFGNRLILTKKI